MKFASIASIFLLALSVNAQAPPHVSQTPVSGRISGTVRVPSQHWVLIFPRKVTGFQHVKVRLPKSFNPRLAAVWIEDIDHPISSPNRPGDAEWKKYDPRNVAVRAGALTFDAVSGDHISYTVGERQAN